MTSKECPPEYAEIFASILKRFDSDSDGKADQKEFCTGIDELRQKINQQMPLRSQKKGKGSDNGHDGFKKSETKIDTAPTFIDNRPSLRSIQGDFAKPEKSPEKDALTEKTREFTTEVKGSEVKGVGSAGADLQISDAEVKNADKPELKIPSDKKTGGEREKKRTGRLQPASDGDSGFRRSAVSGQSLKTEEKTDTADKK